MEGKHLHEMSVFGLQLRLALMVCRLYLFIINKIMRLDQPLISGLRCLNAEALIALITGRENEKNKSSFHIRFFIAVYSCYRSDDRWITDYTCGIGMGESIKRTPWNRCSFFC